MRPSVRRVEEAYQDRVDFHILNVDHFSTSELARQYQVSAIPLIVLLDVDGNEVLRLVGFQEQATLEAALDDMLALGG